MRRNQWIRALVASGVVAATLVGSPAGAIGSPCDGSSAATAPDGIARANNGAVLGSGVYSTTVAETQGGDGSRSVFRMRWVNTSNTTRTIRVIYQGTSTTFTMNEKFFVGGVEVPGGFGFRHTFKNLEPGLPTPEIKIVVRDVADGNTGSLSTTLLGKFKGSADNRCDEIASAVNTAP